MVVRTFSKSHDELESFPLGTQAYSETTGHSRQLRGHARSSGEDRRRRQAEPISWDDNKMVNGYLNVLVWRLRKRYEEVIMGLDTIIYRC